jgi:hypothetical protein
MSLKRKFASLPIIFIFISFVGTIFPSVEAFAAQLQLSWFDNSTNEDGFKIERATGVGTPFTQIATAGANITTYNDSNLTAGTTYCYRVRAYNVAGNSSYSNAACGTASTSTVSLSVAKTGSGGGTVSSLPAGINCGATCTGSYSTGTVVTLTAAPASGSTFAGWSGDSDCSDGSVTMNIGKSCTATFQLQTAPGITLSINLVNTITSAGTGNGSVTSSPAGIDCGQTCSGNYAKGTKVTLTATPASGSVFAGWSGGCSGTGSCVVKITKNISVTATFAPHSVNLTVNKHGNGKVVSIPSGIDCGASCSGSYLIGSIVTLTPNPESGYNFLGWSGGGCSGLESCTVALNASAAVTANFSTHIPASIGVFRPSTGEFFLDLDGNGQWSGCGVDACVTGLGQPGELPVTGTWNNAQTTLLGVFDPSTAAWYLDLNGNGALDGCELDTCRYVYGQSGDLPVVGDWTGNGQPRIGVFRPSTGQWYFDINGNGTLESCKKIDSCSKSFGQAGDLPVVGDWTGNGKTMIGVFRPSTAQWILDLNGDKKMGKLCAKDLCIASFGAPGDIPVVGDWDGSGTNNIGVYRPTTAEWFLDLNGNGQWDGCDVDACLGPFGTTGDLPVVGKW